jgi:hypothetical protein
MISDVDFDIQPHGTKPNTRTTLLVTFCGVDTVAGDITDPITLNKYIYADADPVDGYDPSGHDGLAETLAVEDIGESVDAEGDAADVQASRSAEATLFKWNVYFAGKLAGSTPPWHIKIDVINQTTDAGLSYEINYKKLTPKDTGPGLFGTRAAILSIKPTDAEGGTDSQGFKLFKFTSFDPGQNAAFQVAAAGITIGANALQTVKLTSKFAYVPYPFSVNCTTWVLAAALAAEVISFLPL